MRCIKCGQSPLEAAKRGAYIERTSPKGQPFEGQCFPSCSEQHGDQTDAVINAITDHSVTKEDKLHATD